jgi:hypothetical protein
VISLLGIFAHALVLGDEIASLVDEWFVRYFSSWWIILLICLISGLICKLSSSSIARRTLGGLGLSIPSFKLFFLVKRDHSRVDSRVRSVYPLESIFG